MWVIPGSHRVWPHPCGSPVSSPSVSEAPKDQNSAFLGTQPVPRDPVSAVDLRHSSCPHHPLGVPIALLPFPVSQSQGLGCTKKQEVGLAHRFWTDACLISWFGRNPRRIMSPGFQSYFLSCFLFHSAPSGTQHMLGHANRHF